MLASSPSGSSRYASDAQDAELLGAVARGDDAAFERLYRIFHRRLSRFLMRFVKQHELAEEIVNDAMYQVWKNAARFEGRSSVSTWILGITHRCALHALAQRNRTDLSQTLIDEDHVDPLAFDPSGETAQWIERALDELPLEQRMALELAYFFGYSCEEIAEIAGCPVNTVKTRLFHARRRLRLRLPHLAEPVPANEKLP